MRPFLLVVVWLVSFSAIAQVQTNAEEAFKLSAETKKPVLLIFAGSDWCAPCIRFEKKVLHENTFLTFASENLVVLKADFPQREKLPPAVEQQNEKLAERYNPTGIFPSFLLLNVDGTVRSTVIYKNQSAVEFTSEIKNLLQ